MLREVTEGIEPDPELVVQALHAILFNGFCQDTPVSIADCAGKMGLGIVMAHSLVESELGQNEGVTSAMLRAAAIFRDIVDLQKRRDPNQ